MVGHPQNSGSRGVFLLGSQEPVWVVDGAIQRSATFNSKIIKKFSVDADDISQLAGNAISG